MTPAAEQLLTEAVNEFFHGTASCWSDARAAVEGGRAAIARLERTDGRLFDPTAWLDERIDRMQAANRAWAAGQARVFRVLPIGIRRRLVGAESLPGDDASDLAIIIALLSRDGPPVRTYDEQMGLCSELDAEDGRAVADAVLNVADTGVEGTAETARWWLSVLAGHVPGSLAGRYARIARNPELWGGSRRQFPVFHGADAEARDILFARLSESPQRRDSRAETRIDRLVTHLCWIGDAEVQRRFAEWRDHPPSWRSQLNLPPHGYAAGTGWELTSMGGRRELCLSEGWHLVPAVAAADGRDPQLSRPSGEDAPTGKEPALPGAYLPAPISVARLRGDLCGRCRHPLSDLLDIDLGDPRMAFLAGAGLRGRRLRIPTCTMCMGVTYSSFDTDGNSAWSPHGSDDLAAEPDSAFRPFKPDFLVLGTPMRTPVQWHYGGSHIGGCPSWEEDPWFPECPGCGQSMMVIAKLDLDALDFIGLAYVHVCAGCGLAATQFQHD